MIAIGQILFPWQANGSLITNNQGQVVGSALIGQPFTSDRYFNSRPSTTAYSTANPKNNPNKILQTGISGASNLAPSNPVLIDRIKGKPDPDPAKAIEGRFRLEKAGIKPTTVSGIYLWIESRIPYHPSSRQSADRAGGKQGAGITAESSGEPDYQKHRRSLSRHLRRTRG
jgi:hypothetical protein